MTIKEQLIQEVEAFPDALLSEALDFVLFLKTRYLDPEITTEEKPRSLLLNPPMK